MSTQTLVSERLNLLAAHERIALKDTKLRLPQCCHMWQAALVHIVMGSRLMT